MRRIVLIVSLVVASLMFSCPVGAQWALGSLEDLDALFRQVRALNIERGGYVLGAALTPEQMAVARAHTLTPASSEIRKFRDGNLHVVAERENNRVMVIYEAFADQTRDQVRDRVGELFMAFDEPTVTAHDQLVYWAWGEKGKFDAHQFNLAKEKKTPLKVLATVKFTSEVKIRDKEAHGSAPLKAEDKEKEGEPKTGQAYYVISSEPILMYYAH